MARPAISSPTAAAVKTKYSPLAGGNNKKMFPRKQLKPRELTFATVCSNKSQKSQKENRQEVISNNCELLSTTSPGYSNETSNKSKKIKAKTAKSEASKIDTNFDSLQAENGLLRQ